MRDDLVSGVKTCAHPIVECPGDNSPAGTGAPTGSDTCSSGIISHKIGRASCRGREQISVVAVSLKKKTDACGNHTDQDQTITVKDTTPPSFVNFPINATE